MQNSEIYGIVRDIQQISLAFVDIIFSHVSRLKVMLMHRAFAFNPCLDSIQFVIIRSWSQDIQTNLLIEQRIVSCKPYLRD